MLRKIFLPSFLLCIGTLTVAQNAANTPASPAQADHRSLAETTHWIQQQLETYSSAQYRITSGLGEEKLSWKSTNTYHDFRFKGCEMTFSQDHQRDDQPPRQIDYSVPLWDIASVDYKLDDGDHAGNNDFHYTPLVPSLWIKNHTNSIHWTKPNTYFPTNQAELEFGHDLTLTKPGAPDANLEKILGQLVAAFQHVADLCAAQHPGASSPANGPAPDAAH